MTKIVKQQSKQNLINILKSKSFKMKDYEIANQFPSPTCAFPNFFWQSLSCLAREQKSEDAGFDFLVIAHDFQP